MVFSSDLYTYTTDASLGHLRYIIVGYSPIGTLYRNVHKNASFVFTNSFHSIFIMATKVAKVQCLGAILLNSILLISLLEMHLASD